MINESWITQQQGRVELNIPAGVLSDGLQEALARVNAGQLDSALELLTPETEVQGLEAFVLACLCWAVRDTQRADRCFARACQDLDHPLVLNEAARFYSEQGRRLEAIDLRRRALQGSDRHALIWANLGDDLISVGQTQEGLRMLEKAITLAPEDPVIGSMWLSSLHYGEDLNPQRLADEHRQWGRRFAPTFTDPTPVDPDPDRKLRVGYLSPDFCGHSVAYFFEPLLDGVDSDSLEVFGYGNVSAPDEITARLASKFDHYRSVLGESDQQVADGIRQDRIDILVDLGGHFRGHRLGVFARKPAPIQVTYLGYPDTTGLQQMDYRYTDLWADRPEAGVFHTERLWFLKPGFLCYRPPDSSPKVTGLPAQTSGFVTFGCFNNNAKISEHVMRLWARILHKVPQSKLLLKFKTGSEPAVKKRYLLAFKTLGIAADRIEVLGWQQAAQHLDLYGRLDMALDTYPYHGTATTCEALWMGVPVVSLIGNHHCSRVGLSLLTRVGLEAFTAGSDQEYVDKAVAFAGQVEALAAIRAALRHRMLNSSLCDVGPFCRGVEQAYRAMWRLKIEK